MPIECQITPPVSFAMLRSKITSPPVSGLHLIKAALYPAVGIKLLKTLEYKLDFFHLQREFVKGC